MSTDATPSHRPAHLPPGVDAAVTRRAPVTPPPSIVPLPDGAHACDTCGVAVAAEETAAGPPARPVLLEVRAHLDRPLTLGPQPEERQKRPPLFTVPLTRCVACRARDEHAERLLDGHPQLLARFGPHGARTRLGHALSALAALGRAMPEPDRTDETMLLALMRHLTEPGAAMSWASRYVPVADSGAGRDQCAGAAWSHITDQGRVAARDGAGRLLAERVAASAPPVAVPPPPLDEVDGRREPVTGACLFCGLRAVRLPAAAVAEHGGRVEAADTVWRHLTASTSALGGPTSPQPVTGHVCPSCSKALDDVGSVGLRAAERALRAHLLATGRPEEAREVREGETAGLRTWAALVLRDRARGRRDRPGRSQPWAHVEVDLVDGRGR